MGTKCPETPQTHGCKTTLLISELLALVVGAMLCGTSLVSVTQLSPVPGLLELTLPGELREYVWPRKKKA